jgi:beta-glucosidase
MVALLVAAPSAALRLRLLLCLVAASGACGGDDAPAADAAPGEPDAFVPEPVGSFPAGFLWGGAIAPYQVEGGLHDTDWYQWEAEGFCARCPEGEHADDGPDFWNRYDVDMQNAAAIANNSIRLGIDWSRVFPTRASFPDSPDPAAVQGYHDMFQSAADHGLSVMVTLHHFATPIWLHDLRDQANVRGWEDPAIVDDFARFAQWAAAEYGGEIDLWVTINEPIPYILAGWIAGEGPPGKSFQIELALEVAYNMVYAHARAYDAIHATDVADADGDGAAAMVSIAHHMRVYLPMDADDPTDAEAAEMLRYVSNQVFLDALVGGNIDRNFDFDFADAEDTADDDALKGRLDYVGLNYYGVSLVVRTANDNNFPMIGIPFQSNLDRYDFDAPITDFGWSVYPSGLRDILDEIQPYGVPVIITENGLADATDAQRPRFLLDHLYVLAKAIDDGHDIRGYYHWSLMDNFEWASGYCPQFGLYHVDRGDPERTRTAGAGADVFRQIIEANTVPPDLFRDHTYPGAQTFCPTLPL